MWKSKQKAEFKGFKDRFQLYSKVINHENLDELIYLEFGVSKGESIRWWLNQIKNNSSQFYGFDTFEGIPEDWGTKKKGSYTNNGNLPVLNDKRAEFKVGLFTDTLADFLNSTLLDKKLVVHLDADLYSSTIYTLIQIGSHLKKDDILIFDEFDVTTHEFRAFLDFQQVYKLPYTLVGESNDYNKTVIKIL